MSKHRHSGWLMYDVYGWAEWYVTIYLGKLRVELMRFDREKW